MKLVRALFAVTIAVTVALASVADAQPRRGRRSAPRPAPPPAVAQHVTIMDAASGAILACENCNEPIPPASMAKLMTVLVVLEKLRAGQITMNTRFEVSEYAWREHGAMSDGSHMFLELHSTPTVAQLLRGAVVVSANDACVVLAEGIAGSEQAFAQIMNERARALGLTSAHFTNVTGLDDPGMHISSADLARLARHIMVTYPEFYTVYGEHQYTYNNHTQPNRNPLLTSFQGADGVKTGHTDDSGYGMVGSAVRDGQRRIIVFNGLPSMAARASEAQRLMNSAFSDYDMRQLFAANATVGSAEVRLGSRRTVELVTQQPITLVAPRGVVNNLTARIVYSGPLPAPVAQGARVAELVVEGPGFQTQRFPLVAQRKIGRANWFVRFWEGLRLTFFGP